MVDPVTTLGGGAIVAYLGKDGVQKLLGPTAEYLGNGLKDFTQKRVQTIGEIFKKASDKLGAELDEDASVPPKVIKQIVEDGSFATEELEKEYLSGVLVSSRTSNIRDNRGATIAALVSSLSNYQLRCHFILYCCLMNTFRGTRISPNQEGRPKLATFIPMPAFLQVMELNDSEISNLSNLLTHSFFGLHRDSLIEGFQFGPLDVLKKSHPLLTADADGIVFQPSAFGIELFLWAFGYGNETLEYLFSEQLCLKGVQPELVRITGLPARSS